MKKKKFVALLLAMAMALLLTACQVDIPGVGTLHIGDGKEPAGNNGNTGNNGPKTGDKGAALWFALAGLCGCGLVAMAVTPRYKGKRVA